MEIEFLVYELGFRPELAWELGFRTPLQDPHVIQAWWSKPDSC